VYFLPLFIYGLFNDIVDSPDHTSSNGGMVSEYIFFLLALQPPLGVVFLQPSSGL